MVRGCPARAHAIRSLLDAIKVKDRADGAARRHAQPMSVEDLKQVMEWSEEECPPRKLGRLAESAGEQLLVAKHGLMRALMSTGFTLWTRCA